MEILYYKNRMVNKNMCYENVLPEKFIERISKILPKEELQAFLSSYKERRQYGLRFNPLKVDEENFLQVCSDLGLEKVPWAKEGFFYNPDTQPGKRVLHEAGAYYIQEPSAMAVVEMLDPKPGETILDLCAAPGGKSTQIGGRMLGIGVLVSNEIIPARCKILSQNIERMGISNCIVTNESPAQLANIFASYFDRIVVDAPCSGEGMFRKEPEALIQWSEDNVLLCADRQKDILESAAKMLKPGGILVYSTCTFAREEDEDCVASFLANHEEFELLDMRRFWPHKERGEGHFMAKLQKKGEMLALQSENKGIYGEKKLVKQVKEFLEELSIDTKILTGGLITFGDQIYIMPDGFDRTKGLKIERPGLHLATIKKNRLEPAHALAMASGLLSCERRIEISLEQARAFFKGETIQVEDLSLKGWIVLTTKGCAVGFAKANNGMLKNHYPKGLRKDVIL